MTIPPVADHSRRARWPLALPAAAVGVVGAWVVTLTPLAFVPLLVVLGDRRAAVRALVVLAPAALRSPDPSTPPTPSAVAA